MQIIQAAWGHSGPDFGEDGACHFASAVSSGHSVLLVVAHPGTANPSVTDNKGNAYRLDCRAAGPNGNSLVSIYRASSVTGGSGFVVTVGGMPFSEPENYLLGVHVDAALVLDQFKTNSGVSPTVSPGSLSGHTTNDLAVIAVMGARVGTINLPFTVRPAPLDYSTYASDQDADFSSNGIEEVVAARAFVWNSSISYSPKWACSTFTPWAAALAIYFEPAVASFTGTPTSGASPLTVSFDSSASSGSPIAWSWDFGDGGTSATQNPTHVYTVAGTYTVTLTVSGAQNVNTLSRSGYITVGAGGPVNPPPTPDQPQFSGSVGPMAGPPMPGAPWFAPQYFRVSFPPPVLSPERVKEQQDDLERVLALYLETAAFGAQPADIERALRAVAEFWNSISLGSLFGLASNGEFNLITGGLALDDMPDASTDSRLGASAGMFGVEFPEESPPNPLKKQRRRLAPKPYDPNDEMPTVWLCVSSAIGAALWVECEIYPTNRPSGGATGTYP